MFLGPRTRAPLGAKTTNAKAKSFQTPAGPAPEKDFGKTPAQPSAQPSARKPKNVTRPEAVKLEIHGDESPLTEREVEYAPPKPKDLPYESEVFPDNCLDYDALKKGNLMRGIYQNYHNNAERIERMHKEGYERSVKEADEAILKMIEEDWTVGDVPETFRHLRKKQTPVQQHPKPTEQNEKAVPQTIRGPPTIVSRKAATVLSVPAKSSAAPPATSKPKPSTSFLSRSKPALAPAPSHASTMRHNAATAASKSTIGYTKGRSASGAIQTHQPQMRQAGMTRSVSNFSQASDTTITPARFAQKEEDLEWKKLGWLGAFDVDYEDLEPGLRGALPECLRRADEEDDEFVMTLGSS
jgi:hypothetical protein